MWAAPALIPSPMDILNLTFTKRQFRRGYNMKDVDDHLSLIAANLALPLAQRTLRPEDVRAIRFSTTQFRVGYDEAEVDHVLDQLAVDLGVPSPSELRASAPPVVTAPPTTPARPTDDYRPDPTF